MAGAAEDVKVGDDAPQFSAKDDQGNEWKSSDHVGEKILVVYFYPADFTGGCTKQACGFRDDMGALEDEGVKVVGVSGDTAETHAMFKKAHRLNFTLLSDSEGEIAKVFGVPTRPGGSIKLKTKDSEFVLTRGVTIPRWTFIIDKQGEIAYIDKSVKAAQDSKTVAEAIEKLK